ncbi:MAG TPA: DUF3160 domain-containing protein, partial [Thermoplasmatales archaeon]|nr:DUF3160 domain-containing protein [Thermoplasmatales archaeon]HEX08397.1 DUF3160 domain-containing protein [Thermoplasmatales archaeon]
MRMYMREKILIIFLATTLASISLGGCIHQEGNMGGNLPVFGGGVIIIHPVNASYSNNPKYAIASYYELKGLSISSNVSLYQLPLNLSDVVNIDNITNTFYLTNAQEKLLEKNGFVVIDYGYVDDIIEPYKDMQRHGIPVFVTSDTLLHLYHIQFDEILKAVEEREFFD